MNLPAEYTEHHYQSNDGLSLYYRNYGASDNVLICLPGLTRNCKDFEELARHLASRWRVTTPDLRGRGQSEWDPKPSRYRPETYVGDIWKLMDDLAIQNFTVIGTSLGGWMAMIMASQQGGRLRGVVVNDVGPVVPASALARIMKYAGRLPPVRDWPSAAQQIQQAYAFALPSMPDSFWARFVRLSMHKNSDGWILPDMDPAIAGVLRKAQRQLKILRLLRRAGLMKRASATIDKGYWDQFQALTMPCLLLRGSISDVLPVDLVAQMKAVKPDLQTVTIADRGHAPLLDEPEALTAIDSFLEQLARHPEQQ